MCHHMTVFGLAPTRPFSFSRIGDERLVAGRMIKEHTPVPSVVMNRAALENFT